ncbi:helicase associated domain-containing protein [Leifsonia sp. NPDC058292]|uniref:helicase associated domain-containing protein n=1 Tax=Leifsonia sp. NPDC058292 TaxID=3346428 RepID=UPI0036DD9FEF
MITTRFPADPSRRASHDEDARWRKKYRALARFVEQSGRLPNASFASPEERTLRSWCSTQRQAHDGLGTASMTRERAELLESIPGWEW